MTLMTPPPPDPPPNYGRSIGRHRMTRKVVVRVPTNLYEALRRAAERNDRTISQEVRYRLKATVNDP